MEVQNTEKKKGNWRDFLRLIQETNPPKGILIFALVMSLFSTGASLFIPMLTKGLVDNFSISSISTMQIVGLVAFFVVQTIASGLSIYLLNYIGQKIVAGIRERLWKKVLILPVAYYDQNRTGDTISRMTNDTGVVRTLISEHLSSLLTGGISIVGSLIVLFVLDWKMTVLLLTVIPLSVLILVPLGRMMYKISKTLQDETASFTSVLNQVLSEIRLVKSSNTESREYENGNKGIQKLLQFGLKEGKVQALITPVMSFVLMGLLVIIVGYGGMRVSSGALTTGELVAFILYLVQIIMPMSQLSMFFTQFQKAIGATERIQTILEYEVENHIDGVHVTNAKQSILIENVDFEYNEEEKVLQNIHFTIESGKVTAIVGPSGSGKTTLFSLLERFYEPTSGVIKLGEDPISTYSLQSWRRQIGYVSQDSPLIDGTIRDNICYGVEGEVSDAEIQRVSAMAYVDAFIDDLPKGYDTEVGERGVKLSGGQRQRIAIARALLRDPRILMLDEATSSLDSKSESVVQKALNNLMKGRTTLVIAHRLSTVVDADKIIFIEKGKLTGSGSHDELLRSHNMYREFATQQLKIKEGAI
ncbi:MULTISPECIES: ABC transporter ATP-binding protein [Bacillus cereus group]|uniref:Multidrug ABC transporter permease n=1 Tax=Bacillus cereus TaxID=1396 RepID=A0AA44TF75_BACCE|nr:MULTISPECIES: ABC transporter ATP-binding protein [Bacillus cereus group]PFN08688.1 multidrug ABC transporter permease [Bacillus cereus]PFO84344.1 multidrug ABC transporter permease [Bacillus cereus]PFS02253.1 multidrug ABC transporter permease [Bacillus cereus]